MSEKILDQDALEQLRVFLGDEVEQLLHEFVATTPQRLQQFTSAMAAGNSDEACRIVHALKSSSGNLGLMAFSSLCRSIEGQLREGEMSDNWPTELTDTFQQAADAIHN